MYQSIFANNLQCVQQYSGKYNTHFQFKKYNYETQVYPEPWHRREPVINMLMHCLSGHGQVASAKRCQATPPRVQPFHSRALASGPRAFSYSSFCASSFPSFYRLVHTHECYGHGILRHLTPLSCDACPTNIAGAGVSPVITGTRAPAKRSTSREGDDSPGIT